MSFLNPAFLLGLLLAAPLIAAFLLRVRPRKAPTTALFLWSAIFSESRTTTLFRRLREILSLLILLAASVGIILASARPVLNAADERDLLIIIDTSASMSAESGGRTHLDAAKDRARELVRGLSDSRQAAIATVDSELRFRRLLTESRRELREAIDAIEPTQLPSRSESLGGLWRMKSLSDDLLPVLLTDGQTLAEGAPEGVSITDVSRRGTGDWNAGIVGADLVRVGNPQSQSLALFFHIACDSSEPREAEVILSQNERTLRVIPVTLREGPGLIEVLETTGATGPYKLDLRVDDRLESDNSAYLAVQPNPPIRVAIRTSDAYFFERAVDAFAVSEGLLSIDNDSPEVQIVFGAHDPSATGRFVVFSPSQNSVWADAVGTELEGVIAEAVIDSHPALRFVPVEAIPFGSAKVITAPKAAMILVRDAAGSPLIWEVRTEAAAGLVFNFDPRAGDFFLSPYFPLLMRSAVTAVLGRTDRLEATYATGAPIPTIGLAAGETGTLISKSPQSGQIEEMISSEARVRLTRVGWHELRAPRGTTTIASSLISSSETNTVPVADRLEHESPHVPGGYPLWSIIALVGLAFLVGEELLYHRRKVG